MRVCLVAAHAKKAFAPLAVLYLKAQLVQEGVLASGDVEILEFGPEASPEEIAEGVLKVAPDLVGFSCYIWNVRTLLSAGRLIRQHRPQTRLVLGGPEVGPVARQVLERNPEIDCVVLGEGEFVFAELVTTWSKGGDIGEVKGICHRAGGAVVDNGAAPILRELDAIASPYQHWDADPRGRYVCLETQRGCVFRCNFCFYNKDLSIRNRRFDLGRVKGEILHWLQQETAGIFLMDPVFNLYADRAKEILRFIAEHNHRRIPMHTEIWAEFVDAETATLMREANFQFVEVGLQTTDSAVLATVERRLKLSRFRIGIEHLRSAGVPFELQLIFGLPGETLASFRSSLNFGASLQPPQLAVFPLMVLPGTELHRKADLLGIEYDPEPPYVVRSHGSLGPADIAYGLRVAQAVARIGNLWTIRTLARERGCSFAEVIDSWLECERRNGAEDRPPRPEEVRAFVAQLCERWSIPSAFYERSVAAECPSTAEPAPAMATYNAVSPLASSPKSTAPALSAR